MTVRRYYSVRTGKNPNAAAFDLPILLRLFIDTYKSFLARDYFQQAFGYNCVDAGDVAGTLGSDIESQMLIRLRKPNLWPILDRASLYSEDDIFDVIEFLYDFVSKPIDGWFHQYNGCGWHYEKFDQVAGQKEFCAEINRLVRDYKDGYELSQQGEILSVSEPGLDYLIQANIPHYDPANIEQRVNSAILKFRRYRSSQEDRRDEIRDLADVLEFLRPKLKEILVSKNESDLFNIANNFGIRHHNDQQKTEYDKAIWYSWMFYYYLSTIHASLRLFEKYEQQKKVQT